LTVCDTEADYQQALKETIEWNQKAGYWLGIDPGSGLEMAETFRGLGFGEFLH